MDYPLEIWTAINTYLDPRSLNNLLIILAFEKIDTRTILKETIMKYMSKYKLIFKIYNRLPEINNIKSYINYSNLIYELKCNLNNKLVLHMLIKHLLTTIENKKQKIKFKNLVRYNLKDKECDGGVIISPYILNFIKCI